MQSLKNNNKIKRSIFVQDYILDISKFWIGGSTFACISYIKAPTL